ncbi:MAG: cupin domain-containing protein [Acidaminococcus sp.]|jgi:mannose-6-phosphate isomerase-like protein (cupin superfamily)|nr:cupin domain-containing protein [Acidaminococcus sp.]
MKSKFVAFCLAASILGAGTALAKPAPAQLVPEKHGQCYTAEELFVKDVNGAGGGMGTLHGDFAFRREQALSSDAIKEIGWMTLKTGTFIGNHAHKDNEDAYLIISGKGIFTDGNGNAWVVGPGDMTIARPGQAHGLANLGKEDLKFLDIIAKNDNADLEKITKEETTQCFPVSAQFEKDVEKAGAGKGVGTLYGRFAFRREAATDDQAIKEIGWMTLKPGDSIGMHKHIDNDDTYIIISGKGVFTDSNGKETEVGPQSVTIAGPGESHALRNNGTEDLVFIDLIAKNVPKK